MTAASSSPVSSCLTPAQLLPSLRGRCHGCHGECWSNYRCWRFLSCHRCVSVADQLRQQLFRIKQAFLQIAVLGPLTHSNSAPTSWAGQVVSFLATLGMPCDLITPQSVNVSAVVEKLQSSYLESVNACSGVKMQQYLHLKSEVDSASYTPAAYLQAVGGWRQRKHLAQLRAGSHWLAVETGRYGNARVERAQRLC